MVRRTWLGSSGTALEEDTAPAIPCWWIVEDSMMLFVMGLRGFYTREKEK
jgi:hypothetical protein